MTELEPIDAIHAMSIDATMKIRRRIREMKAEVAAWEPAPWPEDETDLTRRQLVHLLEEGTPADIARRSDPVPGEVLYEFPRDRRWFR